mmetsp:Transcript_42581/g.112282  ORF Transcript_42581/g.112282 Transcript_42581/m.112282 type:complete len:217 (-) Transcript_42581:157-807(-)
MGADVSACQPPAPECCNAEVQQRAMFNQHFSRYLDGDDNQRDLLRSFADKEGESDELNEVAHNFCAGILHDLRSDLEDPNVADATDLPLNSFEDLLDWDKDGRVSWAEIAATITMDSRRVVQPSEDNVRRLDHFPELQESELKELAGGIAGRAFSSLPEADIQRKRQELERRLLAVRTAYQNRVQHEMVNFKTTGRDPMEPQTTVLVESPEPRESL